MFLELHDRRRTGPRWATPLLVALTLCVSLPILFTSEALRLSALAELGVVPRQLISGAEGSLGFATRLASAIFVHADPSHLIGNLIFLVVFGMAVERIYRGRLTLLVFFSCGLLANLIAAVALGDSGAPIVGLSGAVSGLIGAYVYLFPRAMLGIVLPLGLYFQLVRVPAQHLIGLWFLLQVLYTLGGPTLSTVAWWTHVIGFLHGFLLAIALHPILKQRVRQQLLAA